MKKYILITLFLVIIVASASLLFMERRDTARDAAISNFEECAAAGYPIQESYPEQCRTKDGRSFTRVLTPREQAALNCTSAEIPTNVSVDTVLNRENGLVEVRWSDPKTSAPHILLLPYDPMQGFEGCSESVKRVLRNVTSTDTKSESPATVAARSAVAIRANVPESAVIIVSIIEKEWSDACLSAPGDAPEERSCAQVITPGFEITLRASDQTYIYRTDTRGTAVRAVN